MKNWRNQAFRLDGLWPDVQEVCKVENLREGEAPAEPNGLQNTAQQELRPSFSITK
jgi:hypothetical protein